MDIDALKEKIEKEETAIQEMIADANRQIAFRQGKLAAMNELLAEMEPDLKETKAEKGS